MVDVEEVLIDYFIYQAAQSFEDKQRAAEEIIKKEFAIPYSGIGGGGGGNPDNINSPFTWTNASAGEELNAVNVRNVINTLNGNNPFGN